MTLPTSGVAARAATVSLVALVAMGVSAPALADLTKDQCIAANSGAQDLRRTGKFAAASERLAQCADPACPPIIRDDCTQLRDELEKAQPTINFEVKDGSGRDLVNVTATMDGQPLAHGIDGTAIRVDPGSHVFVFTEPGQTPVTQTFVLREGEKDRRERIVIGAPPPSAAAPAAAAAGAGPAPAAAPPPQGMPTQKLVSLIVGGVGVAGLAAGAIFGSMTLSAASQQKNDCSSTADCQNYSQASSAHSSGETTATLSTVSFIAGGALLASAAILFFTVPHPAEQPPAAALTIAPAFLPGGGGLSLRGEL